MQLFKSSQKQSRTSGLASAGASSKVDTLDYVENTTGSSAAGKLLQIIM